MILLSDCNAKTKETKMVEFLSIYRLKDFVQQKTCNHQRSSIKRAVFKIFAIFIRKHLCWSRFLIKLQTLRTPILKKICERLFLHVMIWLQEIDQAQQTFESSVFFRAYQNCQFKASFNGFLLIVLPNFSS